jgi:ABC-type amino acid transport substrate-binding protein
MIPALTSAQNLPKHLICYDDIFQPFFMDVAGQLSGLNVDIIAEAARRIGIEVEFHQMPFKRLELELSRGEDSTIDCGFGLGQTEARKQMMTFGQVAIHKTEYVLFVRDEKPGVTTTSDLTGKVIGMRSGYRLPDIIKDGDLSGRWHIDEVGSDEVNFKKLLLKRVDAVLSNRDVGLFTIRAMKLDGIRYLSPALSRFNNYMVFPKAERSNQLANAFDHALAAMTSDGTIRRMHEKYLGFETIK